MTGARLALEAPAKLNLTLALLGRRADGYHELAGVMVLLELADRLEALPGAPRLAVGGPAAAGVPAGRGANLAWRGLRAGLGRDPQAIGLRLEKRVPAAAGLGGGSSDAAAGWRLGRRLAGNSARTDAEPASEPELRELAAIGADVPFFASCSVAAVVTGVGERVAPLQPPWRSRPEAAPSAVLVRPPFGLRTADVFAASLPRDWSREPPPPSLEPGRNDLLAAALRLRPELDRLAGLLRAAGLEPHLAGSGPTLFGITDDPDLARAVAGRLAGQGLAATVTRLRSRPASIEQLAADDEEERR